jgi:hypothetical protein
VALVYPSLRVDPERDAFVVWIRWVSFEQPAAPDDPPAQGVRVELMLSRNTVLGPTIVYRRDLATPVFLQAARLRVGEVLRSAARTAGRLDIQLVIHGSIAHAPWAGLYVVRDASGESIGAGEQPGTPLLQVQPSTPADRWHVAGQASLRVALELEGERRHLRVLRPEGP